MGTVQMLKKKSDDSRHVVSETRPTIQEAIS